LFLVIAECNSRAQFVIEALEQSIAARWQLSGLVPLQINSASGSSSTAM
jgi:hypothetical protein